MGQYSNKTASLMCKHLNKMSKYVMQKLKELQGETDESSIIVGGFNTLLREMDSSNRQNISSVCSWTQLHHQPTGYNGHLYTISTKNSRIYILMFTWNIHQNRLHLSHKTNFNKFKREEIIQCSSLHNKIKLEINNKNIN